jgi:hypothetical protein
MRTVSLPAWVLAGLLVAVPVADGGSLGLTANGGTVPGTTTLSLQGDPGEAYFLFISLTTGPTSFGGATLQVGFDLLGLSLGLPGFYGVLTGGAGTALLPVPNNAVFAGLTFRLQGVTFPGPASLVDEVSNPLALNLSLKNSWEPTLTSLAQKRSLHTATVLLDRDVLVAGGGDALLSDPAGAATDTADLYDTETETFLPLADPLTVPRLFHTATRLANGKVLLCGGVDDTLPDPIVLSSAEIYDPASQTFAPTGSMSIPRAGHTATLLSDGRVFVAGGTTDADDVVTIILNASKKTEIYDPATGLFTPGPDMVEPKVGHSAVRLLDNRVFVTCGATFVTIIVPIPVFSSVSQIYNPTTNSYQGLPNAADARALFGLTRLLDGRVLLTGGVGGSPLSPGALADAEIFNPAGGSFAPVPNMPNVRANHASVLLADGRVLVAGGGQGDLITPVPITACDAYDPVTNGWAAAASLGVPRASQTFHALPDATFLAVGGSDTTTTTTTSAETYTP